MFFVCTATNIEEVGRFASVEFDDVHGRHGESGAVDQTSNVAVEFDVGEARFLGSDFNLFFFGKVSQIIPVFVSELCVLIKGDFGVESDDAVVGGSHKRVDLQHAAVA